MAVVDDLVFVLALPRDACSSSPKSLLFKVEFVLGVDEHRLKMQQSDVVDHGWCRRDYLRAAGA